MQSDKRDGPKLEWLLTQSRRIYGFAVEGEWEKAVALESERQCLMNKCFSSQVTFDDPQMAARYMQEIIDLDKKVIAMGINAQKELGNTISDLQRGRQATQAYRKIGS